MNLEYLENLISTTLRTLPPVLLAGLGGMLSARVKVTNMGLEGMMLIGAFVAVITTYFTGMPCLGLLAAMLSGAILGGIFAFLKIRFQADNVVVSVAINMLATGITVYLMKVIFNVRGSVSLPGKEGLPSFDIPVLSEIPILRSFSGQSILVYVALILVAVFQFVMYHTPYGLRLRAAGPHPMAVTTAGLSVNVYRVSALVLSGILGAMGGAHLSMGQLAMFSDNMTNGRGFIALAATTFGQFTPLGTLGGAALFSFADAATLPMQTSGFPSSLIQIIPYAITLLTLFLMALQKKRKRQAMLGM